jgi:hypothetical protein
MNLWHVYCHKCAALHRTFLAYYCVDDADATIDVACQVEDAGKVWASLPLGGHSHFRRHGASND